MKKLMNIAKKDSMALAALAIVVTTTIILFVIVVYKYANRICKDDEVLLSQSANSSNGSYWTYELSTEDIIRENNIMKVDLHLTLDQVISKIGYLK